MNENYEAKISNLFAYEVYMLASEYIAILAEHDYHTETGVNMSETLHRAINVRRGIEKRFPQFVGSATKRDTEALIAKAREIRNERSAKAMNIHTALIGDILRH